VAKVISFQSVTMSALAGVEIISVRPPHRIAPNQPAFSFGEIPWGTSPHEGLVVPVVFMSFPFFSGAQHLIYVFLFVAGNRIPTLDAPKRPLKRPELFKIPNPSYASLGM
jgi:hypothetical protein